METIELDGIRIRPADNSLDVGGRLVHLEPKVMAVLEVLLEHPDAVVPRQRLMDRVWAERVVGEEVLTRCISELRTALGDDARKPRFIQTVPKKGYRLIQAPRVPRQIRHGGRYRLAAAASIVVTVTSAAMLGWWASRPDEPTRIAVLPFTADADDGHLGSGITEELINTFVTLPELRVTSRTAAFAAPREADLKQAGERLSVDAVLAGNLNRSKAGLRLSVQLVDVETGDHLWSDTLEGPATTLYSMEDQIVVGVSQALGLPMEPPIRVARTTMNIDALDLYLLGRHHWHERTPEGLARAVRYFREAIDADPSMAEAYSGLADAYLLQANYDDRDEASAIALAEPLIDQALALNPELADAYASRGILLQKQGDFAGAESALASAVSLDPSHVMAHMWRGNAALAMGRLSTAYEYYRTAFGLDPQHPAVAHNYVNTLIELGRYDEARNILASRIASDRAMVGLSAQLALESGDWRQASGLAEAMVQDPVGAELLRWRLEVQRGDLAAAEVQLNAAIDRAPEDERVYLAALEHRTLAPGVAQFDELLASWEARDGISDKVRLMTRAWLAIARVRQGDPQSAIAELAGVLAEVGDSYPPFRMKLMSHLLTALEGTGRRAAYDRWRVDALAAVQRFVDSGWASFEFEVERGYLLAAAGDAAGAAASFRAADLVGDLSTVRLSGDPRIHNEADLLKDFI